MANKPKTYVRTKKGKLKRLSPEQKKRRARAERAAVRRIAKEEGITQKEARRLYKDAVIEVFFDRPAKYAQRRFIEITPGKFQEVPKGAKMRLVNAKGPVRDVAYVARVIGMKQYWELVHIMADEYGISVKQARKKIKKGKVRGESIKKQIWEETGESP